MDLRDVVKRRKEYERQFAQQQALFYGVIVASNGSVNVPNTPDHVYVQPDGTGDIVAVFNPGMKAGPGRGVVCGFEAMSSTLQILHFDNRTTAGVVPVADLTIPNHASTHLIDGEDPLVVYENAIWTLLTYTLGLAGTVVNVSSCIYVQNGQIVVFPGEDNYSLAAYVPTGGLARYVLIYLDLVTNTLDVVSGATVIDSPIYTPVPPAVPDNTVPSALVRLAGGQTVVQPANITPIKDFVFGSSRVRGEFGLKPYYVGTTAERTTLGGTLDADDVGTHFFDTDEGSEYVWDGSDWQSQGGGGGGAWPLADKVNIGAVEYDTFADAVTAFSTTRQIIIGNGNYTSASQLLDEAEVNILGSGVDVSVLTNSQDDNTTVLTLQSSGLTSLCRFSAIRSGITSGTGPTTIAAISFNTGGGTLYAAGLKATIQATSGTNTLIALELVAGTAHLHDAELSASGGSGTKRALDLAMSGVTAYVFGGYLTGDVRVVAGATLYLFGPTITGTFSNSGTATGWYYDSSGNCIVLPGTGFVAGVWLTQAATGFRVRYATLEAAIAAVGSGDIIRLDYGVHTLSADVSSSVASFTIDGIDPTRTTILRTANGSTNLTLTGAGVTIQNVSILNTASGGSGGTCLRLDGNNATLDNVVLSRSGGGSNSLALYQHAGTGHLYKNCLITAANGSLLNAAYYSDAATSATIVDGSLNGGIYDIQGTNSSATLYLSGVRLTNSAISFSGTLSGMFLDASGRVILIGSGNTLNQVKEKLTANRTYYVRTDGSDSNTGLVNSSSGAFLTPQKAVDVAAAFDLNGFGITVNVADGTYSSGVVLRTLTGSGNLTITGNTTTPASVILNSGSAFQASGIIGTFIIQGFRVSGAGYGIFANGGAIKVFFNSIDFRNTVNPNLYSTANAVVQANGNYTIGAGTTIHAQATRTGYVNIGGVTVTLSGTPAFSTAFAFADMTAVLEAIGTTFSGAATGTRYNVNSNAVIFTNGGGATYFPGNAGGATATGGQYI